MSSDDSNVFPVPERLIWHWGKWYFLCAPLDFGIIVNGRGLPNELGHLGNRMKSPPTLVSTVAHINTTGSDQV